MYVVSTQSYFVSEEVDGELAHTVRPQAYASVLDALRAGHEIIQDILNDTYDEPPYSVHTHVTRVDDGPFNRTRITCTVREDQAEPAAPLGIIVLVTYVHLNS